MGSLSRPGFFNRMYHRQWRGRSPIVLRPAPLLAVQKVSIAQVSTRPTIPMTGNPQWSGLTAWVGFWMDEGWCVLWALLLEGSGGEVVVLEVVLVL